VPSLSAACSRAGGGYPFETDLPTANQDAGLGLPTESRLRQRKDFDNVFAHGRAWSGPLLVLRAVSNDLDHNRFGFVTSKRVGGSVVRNKLRRRLREIVRVSDITRGHDIVLSAKTTAPAATFDELQTAVLDLFVRAGLSLRSEATA